MPQLGRSHRKTKIICTLGPATESPEILRELIDAGANIFRLNMSHAKHAWVREIVGRIRTVAAESGQMVGILLDTQGPAIRTGDVAHKLDLRPGDTFEFTVRGAHSEEQKSVDVNYDGLINDIGVGDTVLVDNGVIRMKVLAKSGNVIRCEVLTQGELGSRRHINLPGVKVNLPPLTEKDIEDVELGASLGVDMVSLSFCREPGDIDALRRLLGSLGSEALVIAKIEDQLAVSNIDEIVRRADGIMIARGDLGIECPMEELPIIQRRVIKRCISVGRPVIVATHMLESMISSPMPTRAEVTDVANAVFEQADAIMLSGETSVGKYPVECVRALDRVARRIERSGGAGFSSETRLESDRQKTVKSAIVLADSVPGSRLVVFTRKGNTARFASGLRPIFSPVFAFASSLDVCRRLTLQWGVVPFLIEFELQPNRTIARAEAALVEAGCARHGDYAVILTDMFAGEERFDAVQLRRIA